MQVIKIQLTTAEKNLLTTYKKGNAFTWQIRKRLAALHLADKGYTPKIIAQQLCVKIGRVHEYLRAYKKGGINALITMEKPGKESLFTEEIFRELELYVASRVDSKEKFSALQLAAYVKEKYSIIISPVWIAKRLRDRRTALAGEPWK